jgi:N-acetylmuramoyl-L-alanine amidase
MISIIVLVAIIAATQPTPTEYLEMAVEAEAGICDTYEKQLVASCIMNRVNSDEFPDTIKEVIEEQGQFQVFTNNRINEVVVTSQSIHAVDMVLRGKVEIDILFFANYEISDIGNQIWLDTLTEVYRGMMRYYE